MHYKWFGIWFLKNKGFVCVEQRIYCCYCSPIGLEGDWQSIRSGLNMDWKWIGSRLKVNWKWIKSGLEVD